VKLVLFQTAAGSDATPGLLTERGVVSIADAVSPGATPQLTMQRIIDDFETLRPALSSREKDAKATPLADVRLRAPLPRPGKIPACIANFWEHGAMEARPLNMFMKNPDAVIGPATRSCCRSSRSRGRRLRLHGHDRRVGARGGAPDVEDRELAR
jgi:2-keto-4-pentenoate hydratase/2-oxohepta-3-ene-1,7-dioic acid hydratase in catechol pathway